MRALTRFLGLAVLFLAISISTNLVMNAPPTQAGPPPCVPGDANGDGVVDVSDPIYLLGYIFEGTAAPEECLPGVPTTGQALCYDNSGTPPYEIPCDSATLPGQDRFYQAGCAMDCRFVDNGDGTISDTCTGLMWAMEFVAVAGWEDGLQYTETLELGGHSDWRMPNIKELILLAIYDPDAGGMPVWPGVLTYNQALGNHAWSSTTALNGEMNALAIYSENGTTSSLSKIQPGRLVLPVRLGLD